ncbi:MAG: 4-alpha-glucanotransferase [Chitinophagaceae bacterium]
MTIHFYLRYHTEIGQSIALHQTTEDAGKKRSSDVVPMQYLDNEFWHTAIETDNAKGIKIRYSYSVTNASGDQLMEGENDRLLDITKSSMEVIECIDTWNVPGAYENAFFTSPFQQVLLADRATTVKSKAVKEFTHIFKVKAPLLNKNEVVCLTGSSIIFGDWKKESVQLLTKEGNWWTLKVKIPNESFPLQYKYGVYNTKDRKSVMLEGYENRHLHGNASHHSLTILHDGFARFPNDSWKGAGTAIPVFSLKSRDSFGVGEFTDLILLVDWAKEVGFKLIQILPVNDTSATHTPADSYPYAAISAFALHPIYINLEKVAGKKYSGIIKKLKKKQKELNEKPVLDYGQVMEVKLTTLKELFLLQKETYMDDPLFYEFFQKNRDWLVPYAAFCFLRDKHKTPDSSKWKLHGVYDKAAIEKFVSPKTKHYDEIFLQYFIQYQLHLQLREATEYAHKKGIILKGDIPIGVFRYSVETWTSPQLFNMDMQAGAPPDDFAVKGQNWGFPTYHWKNMQEDGFAWWRQRFEQMSNYFDAFRVDHILGFFRIWSIPIHEVEGIMGHFVHAIPVHIVEFSEKKIWFNYVRYTKPFINETVLTSVFNNLVDTVKHEYLDGAGNGVYQLKESFNTQQKIETYFDSQVMTDTRNSIKIGLFNLISNIILFEVNDSEGIGFHFRIDMDKTSSFSNLDEHTKIQLKDLYVNYFYRRQDEFWKKQGILKLPALKASTNMLICGEDLGMVPDCVPEIMKQTGILSLEIQRMPKDPKREFFHPNDAPYLSVITPSTHDMSTIRGWWMEDRNKTQRFFNNELGQWDEAPVSCEPWINKAIILQHLYAPAMWSIFQLQDILGMSETLRQENPDEERINIPADPKHFWGYRMHFPLEQLVKEKEFNEKLKGYVLASGR